MKQNYRIESEVGIVFSCSMDDNCFKPDEFVMMILANQKFFLFYLIFNTKQLNKIFKNHLLTISDYGISASKCWFLSYSAVVFKVPDNL